MLIITLTSVIEALNCMLCLLLRLLGVLLRRFIFSLFLLLLRFLPFFLDPHYFALQDAVYTVYRVTLPVKVLVADGFEGFLRLRVVKEPICVPEPPIRNPLKWIKPDNLSQLAVNMLFFTLSEHFIEVILQQDDHNCCL